MSEEREPVRLRDDPSQDPALRAMLEAARGESAPDAMLDRVLGNILAGGGGGGSGGGNGGPTFVKPIVITASLVATGAALVLIAGRVMVPSPTHVPPLADAAVILDAGRDAAPIADAGTDAQDVDAAVVRHARIAPPPDPGPDDAALLFRATRMRMSDPAASLALALDHRARFPDSPSREDREALVVLDLAALGRASEARLAADAFRARWPRSADLPHIDAALARLP